MPTFEINSPDGRKFRVDAPDGATQDDVLAQVKAHATANPAPPQNPMLDLAKKVAPFGAGGYFIDAGMGAKQALDSGLQMAARATGIGVPQVDAFAQHSKEAYDASQPQDRPGSSLARGAAPAAAMARFAPAGGGVLANTLLGSAAGGVGSVLEPVYGSPSDAEFWQQKKQQGVTGLATGAGVSGGLGVLGKVISPTLGPMQQMLADAKIRMTPAQTSGGIAKGIEDRLTGYPVIGDLINNARAGGVEDFNRALYTKALAPFGAEGAAAIKNVPAGHQGVAAVGDFLSSKYEQALARSVPTPLKPEFSANMGELSNMVPEAFRKDFITAINSNIKITPAGTITPSVARAADSELGRLVGQYKGSSVASEREYARALAEAQGQLRSMVGEANPAVAPIIEAANKGWATLVQLENAAASVGSKNGVVTPAQFLSAGVKRSDRSLRDRNFARGDVLNQDLAEAAKGVLPNAVPDSGTPGRAALAAAAAAGPSGLLGMFGGPMSAMGAGAAVLPYLPIIGPAINAARISPSAQTLAELLKRYAPAAGLLGVSASAP